MLTPDWRPMSDATRRARLLSDGSRSMRPHDGQVAMAIERNAAVAADSRKPVVEATNTFRLAYGSALRVHGASIRS